MVGKVDDFGIKFDLLVWLIYGVLSLIIVKNEKMQYISVSVSAEKVSAPIPIP